MVRHLRARPARHLTPSEFQDRFREALDATRHIFRKVEALQYYDESGDPSWEAFRRGDHATAMAELDCIVDEQTELLKPALTRGVSLTRLRIVEYPVTDYVRWEFASYELSRKIGEQIFAIEKTALEGQLPDFVSFDDDILVLLEYSAEGKFCQGIEYRACREVEDLIAAYDETVARAVPAERFPLNAP
ncbi:MAG TPA: hypothetical protein VK988_10290 [Acidimicrobiales bacterium]|nr:hypothetical protein [Acidimicrobiales bacterium]